MGREIKYDFALSSSVTEKLEEIASELDKKILANEEDDIRFLADAWQSDSFEEYIEKYRIFMNNVCVIRDEIYSEREQLVSISRRMYLAEEEAKRIAQQREL